MNFGKAVELLKEGKKIKRGFWGGYWVIEEWDKPNLDKSYPLIVAYLKDNAGYAPAQAYQADLLADDWEIIK